MRVIASHGIRTIWVVANHAPRVCAANNNKPAADVAAKLAAGLALAAHYFKNVIPTPAAGSEAAKARADLNNNKIIIRARRAYFYAVNRYNARGENAACSNSAAASNCIGAGCQTSSSGPCDLYCAPCLLLPRMRVPAGISAVILCGCLVVAGRHVRALHEAMCSR